MDKKLKAMIQIKMIFPP